MTDPRRRPRTHLSGHSRYSRVSVKESVFRGIARELRLNTAELRRDERWTLDSLVEWCVSHGIDRSTVWPVVERLRTAAFSNKYGDYDYDQDLRGIVPTWVDDIHAILLSRDVVLGESVVVDVGAADCREIAAVLNGARHVFAVDIIDPIASIDGLTNVTRIINAAEDLRDIPSGSVDLYVSLRTYQSSLFNVARALDEAARVLRCGATILISIANGFVDLEDGNKVIVRGLLRPGSHVEVDNRASLSFGSELSTALKARRFEAVELRPTHSDVFVVARRTA